MPSSEELGEVVDVAAEGAHLGQVIDYPVGTEEVLAVLSAAGDVIALVDDGDGLVDLKLGA